MLHRTTPRRILTLYVGDLVATMLSLSLACTLRLVLPFGLEVTVEGVSPSPVVYLMVVLIWSVVFFALSVYSPQRTGRLAGEIWVVGLGITFSTLCLTGALYISFRGLSRLLFFYFYVLDLVTVIALRQIGRMLLKETALGGHLAYNVLIVGAGKTGQELAQALMSLPWADLHVVGYVDNSPSKLGTEEIAGLPVLGPIEEMEQIISQQDVHEVIFANPGENRQTVADLLASLEEKPISVKVVPDLIDMAFFRATVTEVNNIPLIGLKGPVLDEYQRLAKRFLDLAVGSLSLVLCAPLLLVCAILIRLDSTGPIIFRGQRVGENGKLFWMYKLRTMIPGAQKEEQKLITYTKDGKALFRKCLDDPRVTRFGRYLRRWSLDELPQLFNVVKGEMSLVGPRPELPALIKLYGPGQMKRLCVPPGLTGWWQISDRADPERHSKGDYDLYYLQNYSLWLDLKILWRTIRVVLRGQGAY